MLRMLVYEIELLDSKMNGHIIYLQNHVNNVTIENMITSIEINNIRVGSFVKMDDRKDMQYDKIGKVVNKSDYVIIIDMEFGRGNEPGVYFSHQPDEVNLVVT